MKVSGFTFIKNAIKYGYPVKEAILSILPICDEVVVAVGQSEDETLELIRGISPKVRIVETQWNEDLREGGQVLALETNKAFAEISPDSDWAFYIQGDEVMHEKYLKVVQNEMEANLNNPQIDGLLFKYLHFYGSYDFVGTSSSWYPQEIRVIRNDKSIYSYRDAQGFRKNANKKLRVKPVDAYIYHYGWVKPTHLMRKKQEDFNKYWHDDAWLAKNTVKASNFRYEAHIDNLQRFEGGHPKVMQELIAQKNWTFDYDISFNKVSLKDRLKLIFQECFGWYIGYRNYRLY